MKNGISASNTNEQTLNHTHMSRKVIIITTTVIIAAAAILGLTAMDTGRSGIAYINTAEVYNEFTLKKELETKLNDVQTRRKTILDSMKISLQGLTMRMEQQTKLSEKEMNEFNQIRQQYMRTEQEFDEDNQALANQYSEQIWKQLNQYISDFGKEHNYKYILGTNGEGVVMYADESENITSQVKEYVNSRYGGKN